MRAFLFVVHVWGERFGRIRWRAVNHGHLVAGLQVKPRDGLELAEMSDDELSKLAVRLMKSVQSRALFRRARLECAWVEPCEGSVSDALHAQGAVLDEQMPAIQRLIPRKEEIAAGDDLVDASVASGGEHPLEGTGVSVNV